MASFAFSARNTGERDMRCGATLAHWFSLDLGAASPGAQVAATLFLDPASGTVFARNAAGDPLPVEELWCGIDGADWRTRAVVALPRRIGARAEDLAVACAPEGERLACR